MQKFILLRGHQGSGKSTFAQEKIKTFQKQYPDAEIVHIENDLWMTDADGNYQFTVEGIEQAQRKGQAMMLNLQAGKTKPAAADAHHQFQHQPKRLRLHSPDATGAQTRPGGGSLSPV